MSKFLFFTESRLKKFLLLFVQALLFIFITNNINAEIIEDITPKSHKHEYYDKYGEIILNLKDGSKSTIKVYGTVNTTIEGFDKFLRIIDGIFEKSLKADEPKEALNNARFYLVNGGDHIEIMPFVKDRGDTIIKMFKDVARAVTSKKVVMGSDRKLHLELVVIVSEEYFCKPGLMTRYFTKEDKDHHVYRMGAPIHEAGHMLDFIFSLSNKIKASPDYDKIYPNYKDHHLPEVAPMLVQAWFNSNYTYAYMPRTREELKKQFPNYYNMLAQIFNEDVIDIDQYCENTNLLDKQDKASSYYEHKLHKKMYGKYPKSIIGKYGIKVPNYIQVEDSVYKLDHKYVIDDKTCLQNKIINEEETESVYDCADFCDGTSECKGFIYNPDNDKCRALTSVDCEKASPQGHENNFQYIAMEIPSNTFGFIYTIFKYILLILIIFWITRKVFRRK